LLQDRRPLVLPVLLLRLRLAAVSGWVKLFPSAFVRDAAGPSSFSIYGCR
jgi:hypothetical protein